MNDFIKRLESNPILAETEYLRTPEMIFEDLFSLQRDPRSNEYKEGVLCGLKSVFNPREADKVPYDIGTVQVDAFLAGFGEGRFIAKTEIELMTGTKPERGDMKEN